MAITEQKLLSFADTLPERIRRNQKNLWDRKSPFDMTVRSNFWKYVQLWFREDFASEEYTKYIGVEYTIEGKSPNPIPSRCGFKFFNASMRPDAAIIIGEDQPLVAIEFDDGDNGSKLRDALVKASSSVIFAGYKRSMEFFFVHPLTSLAKFTGEGHDNEKEILRRFRNDFNTELFLIYPDLK